MHPSLVVNRFRCLCRIIPISRHHRVPTRAKLTGGTARNGFTRFRVNDTDLNMRVHPSNGACALLDRVAWQGLCGDGGCFCHAIANSDIAHVHLTDALLHDFHRARRPSHHARTQSPKIKPIELRMCEFGNEHGWNAVQGSAPLALYGTQYRLGLESI